ncbi:glycoside hydrolase superfamily [Lenzites betulinus]|nr:glycoside hydrolase superfamily [Lenzites betulinus]
MSSSSYQPVSDDNHANLQPPTEHGEARNTLFYTPETQPLELHHDDPDDLPMDTAIPRFMGAARYEDNRASYASSKGSEPTMVNVGPEGSSDALNSRSSRGFYGYDYADSLSGPKGQVDDSAYRNEKGAAYKSAPSKSRRRIIVIALIVLAVIVVAVVVPVYFAVIKPKQNNASNNAASGAASSDASGSSDSGTTTTPTALAAVSGGDGSTVTRFDGSTFTYSNEHGGTWYYDPANPLVSGARPQSWTPALNESFQYGVDPIRGVNIGGWLVTEPFIVPALYEKYINASSPAVDEWTLSELLTADNTLAATLENHYKTFITEQDFAEIAAAGLNFVRIPIAYWAIEVRENEPFLPKTSWTYFLKAIEWARKYGLRINLDLHALPGSQNGWNHSSKLGNINVLLGPMGIANAERALDYIRIIAEFISQPEYKDVIPLFGIMNEPFGPTIGKDAIQRFYLEAYNIVRNASGTGEGNGPWVVFHDAFLGLTNWQTYLRNADRTQLDIHQYLCFSGQSADDYGTRVTANQACDAWAAGQNTSMNTFGMTHVGEWSLGINDCGKWLNGVNLGARYDGSFTSSSFTKVGDCDDYTDYTKYNATWKADMKDFALQSMSALQNWFFWTWKVGNSTISGRPESPAWSYQLGIQEGWMPTDPRDSQGSCDNSEPFTGSLKAWMTGGSGAGQIAATAQAALAWPPTSLTDIDDTATIPQYTQTGAPISLPAPTVTAVSGAATSTLAEGSWNNPSDTASVWVPIASCGYLDPWMGPSASPDPCPAASSAAARRAYAPRSYVTPAPVRAS